MVLLYISFQTINIYVIKIPKWGLGGKLCLKPPSCRKSQTIYHIMLYRDGQFLLMDETRVSGETTDLSVTNLIT